MPALRDDAGLRARLLPAAVAVRVSAGLGRPILRQRSLLLTDPSETRRSWCFLTPLPVVCVFPVRPQRVLPAALPQRRHLSAGGQRRLPLLVSRRFSWSDLPEKEGAVSPEKVIGSNRSTESEG